MVISDLVRMRKEDGRTQDSRVRLLNLGLFGTFYPFHYYAGNSSIGLTAVASSLDDVNSVTVFCTPGSELPTGIDPARVRVVICWQHDNPFSLLSALVAMLVVGRKCDAVLFNVALTSFGRSKIPNALGLLLPVVLKALSGKSVSVYLHNLLETQDYQKLGYRPSRATLAVTSGLERFLLGAVQVFVPLESQRRKIVEALSRETIVRPLPYIEAFWGISRLLSTVPTSQPNGSDRLRILLFGEWGPQKDLETPLRAFQAAIDQGLNAEMLVAGIASSHFPEWGKKVQQLLLRHKSDRVRELGAIPENEVATLFASADLLVLPYNTTGGYSGAMNWAAACGVPVLAYDLPQLREFDELVGAHTKFVPPGSYSSLLESFLSLMPRKSPDRNSRAEALNVRRNDTVEAVRVLLTHLQAR
jgi:glycosyltransferase involved in cell wall biosynthesis